MAHIKTVMAEAVGQVQGGKAFEQRIADGGYSLRVQRTSKWNSRTARVVGPSQGRSPACLARPNGRS